MPAVSIVVPVYGVEKYLHQCLDSIQLQTFKDWECILIDDGSPDNCGSICDDYADRDSRFKVIHKNNGGVSRARNDGLDIVRGTWTYIIDSDDWIERDSLEKLYAAGEKHGVDCVMSGADYVDPEKSCVRHHPFHRSFFAKGRSEVDKIQKCILYQHYDWDYSCYTAPWSKFIRTEVLRKSGLRFDSSLGGVFDDGLFSLWLFELCDSVYYLHDKTYNYRIVSGSITRSYKPDAIEREMRGYLRIEEFLRKTDKSKEFWQAYYSHIVIYIGAYLSSFYFSPLNPVGVSGGRKQLKADLKRDPIWTATHCVRMTRLKLKDAYLAFCEKYCLISALHLYVVIKHVLGR